MYWFGGHCLTSVLVLRGRGRLVRAQSGQAVLVHPLLVRVSRRTNHLVMQSGTRRGVSQVVQVDPLLVRVSR